MSTFVASPSPKNITFSPSVVDIFRGVLIRLPSCAKHRLTAATLLRASGVGSRSSACAERRRRPAHQYDAVALANAATAGAAAAACGGRGRARVPGAGLHHQQQQRLHPIVTDCSRWNLIASDRIRECEVEQALS